MIYINIYIYTYTQYIQDSVLSYTQDEARWGGTPGAMAWFVVKKKPTAGAKWAKSPWFLIRK